MRVQACRNQIYALRFDILYFCDETRWPPSDGFNLRGVNLLFFYYLILKWGLQDDLTTDLVRVFGHIVLGDIKGKIDLVFLIKGPTIGMSQLLLASSTVSELGSVLDKEDG